MAFRASRLRCAQVSPADAGEVEDFLHKPLREAEVADDGLHLADAARHERICDPRPRPVFAPGRNPTRSTSPGWM